MNIGKMLFPNQSRDLRRREMNVLCLTAFTTLVLAGIVVVVITRMGKLLGH